MTRSVIYLIGSFLANNIIAACKTWKTKLLDPNGEQWTSTGFIFTIALYFVLNILEHIFNTEDDRIYFGCRYHHEL